MEEVIVEILREDGCDDIDLPEPASEFASGADLRAAVTEPVVLEPGKIVLIPVGFKMACPPGYEAQVRPRSGLALKCGITVMNAPGTIDADYRGPVGVILGNLGTIPYTVNRGDRIAQLVVQAVPKVEFKVVRNLTVTERDEGGFGSSGIV